MTSGIDGRLAWIGTVKAGGGGLLLIRKEAEREGVLQEKWWPGPCIKVCVTEGGLVGGGKQKRGGWIDQSKAAREGS